MITFVIKRFVNLCVFVLLIVNYSCFKLFTIVIFVKYLLEVEQGRILPFSILRVQYIFPAKGVQCQFWLFLRISIFSLLPCAHVLLTSFSAEIRELYYYKQVGDLGISNSQGLK